KSLHTENLLAAQPHLCGFHGLYMLCHYQLPWLPSPYQFFSIFAMASGAHLFISCPVPGIHKFSLTHFRFSSIHLTAKSTSSRCFINVIVPFPRSAFLTWHSFSKALPISLKSSPST